MLPIKKTGQCTRGCLGATVPEALNGTLGTGQIERLVEHVLVLDDQGGVHNNGLDATQIVQRIEDKWDYVAPVETEFYQSGGRARKKLTNMNL